MNLLRHIIPILIGLLFILSALAKAYAIEGLEIELYTQLGSYFIASLFSKALIGLELAIGLCFLFRIYFRYKLVIKVSIILVLIFTGYLAWQYHNGKVDNCQCFGELIPMSPLQSIIKNLILLALLVFAHMYTSSAPYAKQHLIGAYAIIFSLPLITCITLMVYDNKEIIYFKPYERKALLLNELKTKTPYENISFSNKALVAFFSAHCPHCYHIGKQMAHTSKLNPRFKILSFVNGDTTKVEHFMQETQLPRQNSFLLNGPDFINRSGNKLPAIYLVKNDTAYARIRYLSSYQLKTIDEWLSMP